MKRYLTWGVGAWLATAAVLSAGDLTVVAPNGERVTFAVDEEMTQSDLADSVAAAFGVEVGDVVLIDSTRFADLPESEQERAYKVIVGDNADVDDGVLRDYAVLPTEAQAKDIKFIVMTLSKKHELELFFMDGQLKAAGDRIENVHPYRFLEVIFTDEETKGGVRNVREKTRVWPHFMSGVKRSFNAEKAKGNLKDEFLVDMASQLFVSDVLEEKLDLLRPHVANSDWTRFVFTLIDEVPRGGDTDRYDM